MRRWPLAAALPLALCSGPAWSRPAETSSAEVLSSIQRRVTHFLRTTSGIASTRRVVTRVYDPDGGRLIQTTEALQEHVFFHHRKPRLRILSCRVDGRKRPADDCDSRFERNDPHIPVLGPKSHAHYRVRITGQVPCGADRCHQVEVTPRQRSVRHFQGKMLFRVGDLLLKELQGGVSQLPFPLERLFIKLHFTRVNRELVATSRGYLDVWVRVPLLYKRRFVTRFESYNSRAVPRAE